MLVFSLVALSIVFGVVVALAKPRPLLVGAVFFLPWAGLQVDIGLNISLYRLILTALIIAAAFSLGLAPKSIRNRTAGLAMVVFVVYAVVWSVAQVPTLPSQTMLGGQLRAPGPRAMAQIVAFLLGVGPVLLGVAWVRSPRMVGLCARAYVASIVVLCLIGWMQLAIWWLTGSNPLPVGFVQGILLGGESRDAVATVDSQLALFRMNSLGGEPKYLAQSIAVAMLIIQTAATSEYWRRRLAGSRIRIAVWALMAVSLVATLSTAGVYVWIIGTAALIAVRLMSPAQWTGLQRSFGWSLAVIVSVAIPWAIANIGQVHAPASAPGVAERVIRSRTERGVLEDFDIAVGEYLISEPEQAAFGAGLGNAHLHAEDYLPAFARGYASQTAFVAKIGALKLVSELGLVGLSLFLAWAASLGGRLMGTGRESRGREAARTSWQQAVGQLIVVATILYLARTDLAEHTYLVLGLAMGLPGPIAVGRPSSPGPVRAG